MSASNTHPTKRECIVSSCEERNIESLIALATSEGGLLHDDLRKAAWPLLLGYNASTNEDSFETDGLSMHRDEEQVKLDVNRAFVYYPNDQTDKQLETKKKELFELIISVLRKNPMLGYFQGYHDIAQVLLLVLGPNASAPALERVSLLRIRDFMLPTLSPAVKHLQLLPALIHCEDPSLYRHLSGTRPFFALAATLTLYAHDIQEYSDIARLYDFLLSHEPLVSIYMFGAIIISRRTELLEISHNEPEMMHFTLSKLPQPLDLEKLIENTMKLYKIYPPGALPFRVWKKISSHSVLRTSRNLALEATIPEAQELFRTQAQELQREETRRKALLYVQKNSRLFGSIGLAVFIGVFSYWLAKSNFNPPMIWRLCQGTIRSTLWRK